RCLNLGTSRGRGGDRRIELGVVLTSWSQNLHGFQTVPNGHGTVASEKRRQIAVEREPSHLGAVIVVVVTSPSRLHRMTVASRKRGFQQRVSGVHAGIQNTDGRLFVVTLVLNAANEVGNPFPLLGDRLVDEERGEVLGAPELRDVAEHVE